MTLEYTRVTIATPLVSLTVAKARLKITDSAHDADLTALIEEAQDHVLAKLGLSADPTWTETSLPPAIRNCILLLVDAFNEHHGGAEEAEGLRKALEAVEQLLGRFREPSLA